MPLFRIARSATRTALHQSTLKKVHALPRALLVLPTTAYSSSLTGQSSSHLRSFHTTAPSFKKKMPPKKKAVEEKKVILGRPGNNLKVCLTLGDSCFNC